MRLFVMALGTLSVAGCVTTHPVAMPDGSQGIAINCPGTVGDIGNCMNEAAKVCGGPYQLFNQDSGPRGGAFVSNGSGGGVFVPGNQTTLIVKCGAAPAAK